MNAKYICIEYELAGDSIFIFPEYVSHEDFAHILCYPNDPALSLLSAGFIRQIADGSFTCHGESVSLGIKSRPEIDTAIVNRMLER